MRIPLYIPRCAFLLLICAVSIAPLAPAADVANCSLVPGWQQAGALRHFTPDNLYEYMDGNAESYLAYGFTQTQGVTCKSGENTLVIDISEMIDPDAAYGIFSGNRDPAHPLEKIGMGGQVLPRRGTFSKGNYYVEISASPDLDHTPELTAFIAAMEKLLDGRTTTPDALAWFPPEKLVSARMIPESVLGVRLLKRGYVAQYDQGKAFLVLETSPLSATAVMAKLRVRYPSAQAAQVAEEALQLQDKYLGGVCFFRKGKYIGGYANMPDGATAAAASVTLAARVP
ncbi:MAG TPA: DUF6599 family protein [Terriglobia bacterium]|nr:DUF6599 family protein [Terriglobia bacterium]